MTSFKTLFGNLEHQQPNPEPVKLEFEGISNQELISWERYYQNTRSDPLKLEQFTAELETRGVKR